MVTNHKLNKFQLSPLVGAVVLALSAPVAMAAAPAPATLPGAFYTNQSTGVTYASSVTNAASITVPSGATVLQFGGSSASVTNSVAAASGITTAAGFNIGSAASLTVSGPASGSSAVLINDITANPSQIYGTLTASGSGTAAPTLFVANANGVVIGGTADITLPNGGGIIGEAQNPSTFVANSAVASGAGTGAITILPNANATTPQVSAGGYVLVAGNGNINISDGYITSNGTVPTVDIIAGYNFSQSVGQPVTVSSNAPTASATLDLSSAPGEGTFSPVATVYAAGNVNILANSTVDMANTTFASLAGTFTNDGTATLGSSLSAGSILNNGVLSSSTNGFNLIATGAGGSVVNNGVLNVVSAGTLSIMANNGGTVTNNGFINFYAPNTTSGASSFNSSAGGVSDATQANPNYLNVSAQNVNMFGTVNQATAAGATPTALYLNATGGINALSGASLAASTNGGVLNFGTTIVSVSDQANPDLLQGDAVRILSGRFANRNIFDQGHNGTLNVDVGSGPVGNYGYNLSIFPGAILQAWHLNVNGTATTNGSNINLDGTIQSNNAVITADNLHATSFIAGGPNGSNGFRIMANSAPGTTPPTDGSLELNVAGNVNNPNGAADAGQPVSTFQYNYVPVTVFGGNGTSYISVRPTNTANAPQLINLLVNGSAILGNSGVSNAGSRLGLGVSIVPSSSYPNSHLVVSATGNLTFGPSINSYWGSSANPYNPVNAPYYWPGLMVFSNITSAADPTSVGSGNMTLADSLSNVIPTNVSGNGGIFFETGILIGGLSSTNYVLTNTNSWINFPVGTGVATVYGLANASNMNFYGATVTTNASAASLLTTQVLPGSDIVAR